MSLRSPLSRAKGLGSAKTGVHHFWMQRVSAIALVPLTLWFVFSIARLAGGDYASVQNWVSAPSVAVVLILFLVATLYHSMLGVQTIVEDYVGHEGARIGVLLLSKFAHAAVAAATIFAVLKVALA
ncbi:succinate dehydrogenase, hydrophobic membrane anchor protein [Polycyclovorans algicola]|uniref:succinate dehydrogenase, hydrophobic membrane anchor protein n=1 Tax=Polycyclovorans algicola TaxID=616992 RepID=UPI0004A75214|nr:succinate dehydrogenase, hydrophobic membrane anchor protein [Polycyclovorans algicola]